MEWHLSSGTLRTNDIYRCDDNDTCVLARGGLILLFRISLVFLSATTSSSLLVLNPYETIVGAIVRTEETRLEEPVR